MSKLVALTSILLASCSGSQQIGNDRWSKADGVCENSVADPQRISIAALLADPGRFEGKPVTVIGFYHASFEHSAIYLSRDDFQHHVTTNGLWVASVVKPPVGDRYVMLDGIFTAAGGHLGQWSGTLCGVSRAVPWGPDEA